MSSAEVQALIEEARRLPYDRARLIPRLADALEAENARADTLFEELDEANVKLAWERAAHKALRQQVERLRAQRDEALAFASAGNDLSLTIARVVRILSREDGSNG